MEAQKWREMVGNVKEADMQDLLDAVLKRYRELYPKWDIFYCAVSNHTPKERRRQVWQIICFLVRYELFPARINFSM